MLDDYLTKQSTTMANQECLNALETFSNKDISQHQEQINQEIENYKSFYVQKGVPEGSIFLSAIVSAKKLIELCQDVDFLAIQLAKSSDNVDDVTDFKFIISQSDKKADIIPAAKNFGIMMHENLDFNNIENFAAQFTDVNCCRCPPGTGL